MFFKLVNKLISQCFEKEVGYVFLKVFDGLDFSLFGYQDLIISWLMGKIYLKVECIYLKEWEGKICYGDLEIESYRDLCWQCVKRFRCKGVQM